MDAPAQPLLSRKALRDDVHEVLLRMLMTQQFPPGANLSIDSIARQLGVSPTPVREALVQIEATGLVKRTALKGYSVSPPLSSEAMAELMDARMVLEVAAVSWAASRANNLVGSLRECHQRHVDIVERYGLGNSPSAEGVPQDRVLEYFEADWAFHQAIIQACGNRFVAAMAAGLGANVHRMRQSHGAGPTDSTAALAEHARVLAAFETGDVGAAVEAMRSHLMQVRDRAIADSPDS